MVRVPTVSIRNCLFGTVRHWVPPVSWLSFLKVEQTLKNLLYLQSNHVIMLTALFPKVFIFKCSLPQSQNLGCSPTLKLVFFFKNLKLEVIMFPKIMPKTPWKCPILNLNAFKLVNCYQQTVAKSSKTGKEVKHHCLQKVRDGCLNVFYSLFRSLLWDVIVLSAGERVSWWYGICSS